MQHSELRNGVEWQSGCQHKHHPNRRHSNICSQSAGALLWGVELRTISLGSLTTLLGLRPQRPCHHSAGVSPTSSRSPLISKQHLLLLHFHMTSFPSELREPKGLLPPWLAALVRIHSRTYLKGGILLLCIHFICINVRCWNLVECFSLVRDSTPTVALFSDWLIPSVISSWHVWVIPTRWCWPLMTPLTLPVWSAHQLQNSGSPELLGKPKKITGGLKHQCRKMWQARSGWLRERGGVTGRATGGWETHFQEKPPLEKRSPGGQVLQLHPFPACMASLCYPWSSGAPIPALSTCLPLLLLP